MELAMLLHLRGRSEFLEDAIKFGRRAVEGIKSSPYEYARTCISLAEDLYAKALNSKDESALCEGEAVCIRACNAFGDRPDEFDFTPFEERGRFRGLLYVLMYNLEPLVAEVPVYGEHYRNVAMRLHVQFQLLRAIREGSLEELRRVVPLLGDETLEMPTCHLTSLEARAALALVARDKALIENLCVDLRTRLSQEKNPWAVHFLGRQVISLRSKGKTLDDIDGDEKIAARVWQLTQQHHSFLKRLLRVLESHGAAQELEVSGSGRLVARSISP
jgi:hypothetical protein